MRKAWEYCVRDWKRTVENAKVRAWRFFYWSMPGVVQARTDELVRQNSVRATMLYLDKEGLSHCSFCPSRFSLSNISTDRLLENRVLACPSHLAQAKRAAEKEKQKCLN